MHIYPYFLLLKLYHYHMHYNYMYIYSISIYLSIQIVPYKQKSTLPWPNHSVSNSLPAYLPHHH
jgi:hypothetical protein